MNNPSNCGTQTLTAFGFYQQVIGLLRQLVIDFGNPIDSEIVLLCVPVTGVPVVVRYKYSFTGGIQTTIATDAWNIDGTPYIGDKTLLVSCTGGSSGGGGSILSEYFICDDGIQKLVRHCGTDCSTIATTFYLLDGTTSTEPADWSIVRIGKCPGGGIEDCCCTSWQEYLCWFIPNPPGTQLVYRENNTDVTDHLGTYVPYTWFPDAPYVDPLYQPFPSAVSAPDPVLATGNPTFSPDFSRLYSWYNVGGYPGDGGHDYLIVTDTSDTSNATIISGPTICHVVEGDRLMSIVVNPVNGLLYCTLRWRSIFGTNAYVYQFDPAVPGPIGGSTGALTEPGISNIWILGIDLLGNGYLFDNLGNCFAYSIIGGMNPVALWSTGSTKYVYMWMGYAGNTHYGVVFYDPNTDTYSNAKIDISTGAIIDELSGIGDQRALFFQPNDEPAPIVTEFKRIYIYNACDDVTFTQDKNIITGADIVLPDGAVVDRC